MSFSSFTQQGRFKHALNEGWVSKKNTQLLKEHKTTAPHNLNQIASSCVENDRAAITDKDTKTFN